MPKARLRGPLKAASWRAWSLPPAFGRDEGRALKGTRVEALSERGDALSVSKEASSECLSAPDFLPRQHSVS